MMTLQKKSYMDKCSRCKGIGISFWDAFNDGWCNIVGGFFGEINQTKCHKCKGKGFIV